MLTSRFVTVEVGLLIGDRQTRLQSPSATPLHLEGQGLSDPVTLAAVAHQQSTSSSATPQLHRFAAVGHLHKSTPWLRCGGYTASWRRRDPTDQLCFPSPERLGGLDSAPSL